MKDTFEKSWIGRFHWWQAHYEELKADRDTAEHQAGDTARQLSRNEKQLKETQDVLSNSTHEVCHELDQFLPLSTRLPVSLCVMLVPVLNQDLRTYLLHVHCMFC